MTIEVKNAGTWSQANDIRIKDGGTWKQVQQVWKKDGGTWKLAYSLGGGLSNQIAIGGFFTAVNGVSRNDLASVDSVTGGNLSSWNPNLNSYQTSILADTSNIYVGGYFTTVGVSARGSIAAFDKNTGNVTTWNPSANGNVQTLAFDSTGAVVYVGGQFTKIGVGGTNRNFIAAIDKTTGNATTWNPSANGTVMSLAVSGNYVYIGGNFLGLKGGVRNYAGAVDTSGNLLVWNPTANAQVNTILISSNRVFLGGAFTWLTNSGNIRNYAGSVDPIIGTLNTWRPMFNSNVDQLIISGGSLIATGIFVTVNTGFPWSYTSRNLAMVDTVTGMGNASWSPNYYNSFSTVPTINSVAVSGNYVYIGGQFDKAGGNEKFGIAAFDTTSGIATSWTPIASGGGFNAAVTSGAYIFCGGQFNTINGLTRNNACAFDLGGNLTNWNPNFSSTVRGMSLGTSSIFFAGLFSSINGSTVRNFAAACDTVAGSATPWNPNLGSSSTCIAISGWVAYLGGVFNTIGGTTRVNAGAVTITGAGTLTAWNPAPDAQSAGITPAGNAIYMAGSFLNVNIVGTSAARNNAAAFTPGNGLVLGWNPNFNALTYTVFVSGSAAYVGGTFSTINTSASQKGLCMVDSTSGLICGANAGIGTAEYIQTIITGAGFPNTLFVGGSCHRFNNTVSRLGAARCSTDLTVQNWDPSPISVGCSVISGSLYYAFNATNSNTLTRYGVAQFDAGANLLNWAPSTVPATGSNIQLVSVIQ